MSKRVLIVDDTAYMRALIRDTLINAGYVVVGQAEDGVSAISLYQQQQPDLVIMNIVMPKMNGMDALKKITEWDGHARVLMCSAMAQAPAVLNAIRAGASDFLIKPFEPKQLLETVGRILERNVHSSR